MTVTIDGNGYALNGNGTNGGVAVLGGKVTVQSLTIEDTVAQGGTGTGSGGGGAGLGGGVFVGPNADVTLQNVMFQIDKAKGGAARCAATSPSRLLPSATSSSPRPVDAVTYWHVELESHDVIRAEDVEARDPRDRR